MTDVGYGTTERIWLDQLWEARQQKVAAAKKKHQAPPQLFEEAS